MAYETETILKMIYQMVITEDDIEVLRYRMRGIMDEKLVAYVEKMVDAERKKKG